MKKWFTLIGLCCLMTGMISATNQPLKRISPVQAAQMRLGVLNEGTTRMEETVRPIDTKNIGRILSRSAVSSVTGNSSAFRNAVSADSWLADGNYDISWYDETKDEFSLSSPAQLAGLSYLVRAGKKFQYCTVRLSADIDLSNYKWIPIGTRGVEFKGLFDGGGHTISGLHTDMEVFSGLFGAVASTDIRNVMLSSSCVVVGSVAGSIAGSMNESAIMNCRSDAAVQGYTAGGLVGNSDNSSVLASIFNGRVSKLEASNAWVGSYTVTAGSPFEGEGTQSFEVTIEADDSSPERLTIGWSSSRYGIVYTLTGFIEDDGCLHISIGEQQLGSYGAYTMMLVRYTDDGIFASGEVVGSLSDDNNTITFSVSPASYLMIAAVENDQVAGWLEGYVPPFMAVKNEAQIMTGGIVGTSYNTFLEKCFYGDGCVGDNHNEVGTVLPSSELLSDAQVRTMNSAASGIVLSDPFVSSLKMWRPGENGPALIEEDYVQSNWWTSAGNYDISWYDEAKDSFSISTPAQLAGVAYLVKTGRTFEGKTVTLSGNIDLDGLKWEPIGKANLQQIFKGVFDGGGYEIHNLRSEVISTGEAYSGLFGAIYQARVTRVVLAEDCEIRTSYYGGGVVAYAQESEIVSCENRASVSFEGPAGYVGGIAGYVSTSSIDRCENLGVVTGTVQPSDNYASCLVYTGGIAGVNQGATIINNSNHAAVAVEALPEYDSCAGGIVGYNSGSSVAFIANCYNAAGVRLSGAGFAGGILSYTDNGDVRVANCYNVGTVSGVPGKSYPIVPILSADSEDCYYLTNCVEGEGSYAGTALTVDYMKSTAFAARLNDWSKTNNSSETGRQTLYWKVEDAENDGYPVFTDQDPGYTGVESVVSGVRIYPTTVSGELFVCGAESPIYIYNLAGHIVSIIDPTEEITVVDMSRLVAGVYLVRTGDKVVRLVKL